MAVTGDSLRTLHRIHNQLSDLNERFEIGPKRVLARERYVEAKRQELAEAKHEAQQARVAVDKKQLDLKISENKNLDWKARLNSCTTNKEYQALVEQIAAAEMAGSVLSDEILEALERIDQLDAKVEGSKSRVGDAEQELDKIRKTVEESAGTITADITRLKRELAEIEDTLPADFRADYDRGVRARGADAMAPVEEGSCTGCYRQVTANVQNSLILGRTAACQSCGRLLFLAEDGLPREES